MLEIIKEENKVYIKNEDDLIIAYASFPEISKGVVELDHTVVDESLRGMGVAGKLMIAAYEVIKSSNRKAVLSCSYAVNYFEKHPELKDILK